MSDKWIGNFKKGQIVRVKFNTFSQAKVPATPSVNPVVTIYKDSVTEFTTGVTQPTINFDGRVGVHEFVIDTSDPVYEIGKDYDVMLTAGTVDGLDLSRTIIRTFSIENRLNDVNVTQIAGQTVNASAAVTFPASVASPTNITQATGITLAGVNHTGAVIPTVTDVTTKTGYSLSSSGVQAIWDFLTLGILTVGSVGKLLVDNLNAAIGSIPTNPLLSTDPRIDNLDAAISSRVATASLPANFSLLAINSSGHISRVTLVDTTTVNTDMITATGIRNAVGLASANLDTQLSLLPTINNYIDTEIASIKVKTDQMVFTTAGRLDTTAVAVLDKTGYSLSQAFPTNFASLGINASGHISRVTLVDTTTTNTDMITATSIRSAVGLTSANLDSQLSTIAGYVDTEIGSIKAKTDQMVFTTAGRLDTTAVAVLDKSGYTLSQAFPTNFSSLNINIDGKVLLQPDQTGVTIPTVTSITNGVSVSSIGTNVITSDVLATSAVTEIQSGLSTLTSTDVRNAVGLASANLDTQLGNIYADTTNLKTRLPAALINNRIDATIGNIQNDVITNASFATSAVDEIVDGVWNEPYNQHTTAGTFGKLMDLLRKANTLVEGTVTAAITPTTTTFSSTVNYPTGALEHSVLMWISGNLIEQNSPIITYVNANGQITAEEAFTSAPQVGDQFIIAPLSHVHAVSDIQNGLALQATSQSILSGVNTLTSRITAGVASMFQDLIIMIQGTGTALAKWTAAALSLAPTGSGGGGAGNVTVNANILPIQSYMRKRVEAETMSLYYAETTDVFISVEDENGPVDLTSKTLEFVIETKNKTNLLVIASNDIGKSVNGATVRITTTVTNNIGTYLWALRDLTGGTDTVLSQGYAEVSYAPKG
jgi:hypothetical protein